MSKKLVVSMLVAFLLIGGGVLVKPDTASAAKRTFNFTVDGDSIQHTLDTYISGSTLQVSVKQGNLVKKPTYICTGCTVNIKLELQKRTNGTFKTITTQSGWVSNGNPMSRAFTSIGTGTMRVKLTASTSGRTLVVYGAQHSR